VLVVAKVWLLAFLGASLRCHLKPTMKPLETCWNDFYGLNPHRHGLLAVTLRFRLVFYKCPIRVGCWMPLNDVKSQFGPHPMPPHRSDLFPEQ
jgi:hypothetical protein